MNTKKRNFKNRMYNLAQAYQDFLQHSQRQDKKHDEFFKNFMGKIKEWNKHLWNHMKRNVITDKKIATNKTQQLACKALQLMREIDKFRLSQANGIQASLILDDCVNIHIKLKSESFLKMVKSGSTQDVMAFLGTYHLFETPCRGRELRQKLTLLDDAVSRTLTLWPFQIQMIKIMFLARNYLETDGRWTKCLLSNIEIFVAKIEELSYPCEAYLISQIKKTCLDFNITQRVDCASPLSLLESRHALNYIKYYFVRVAYCLMQEKSLMAMRACRQIKSVMTSNDLPLEDFVEFYTEQPSLALRVFLSKFINEQQKRLQPTHGMKRSSLHSLALIALHAVIIDDPQGKVQFLNEIPIEVLDNLDAGICRPIMLFLEDSPKTQDDEILLLQIERDNPYQSLTTQLRNLSSDDFARQARIEFVASLDGHRIVEVGVDHGGLMNTLLEMCMQSIGSLENYILDATQQNVDDLALFMSFVIKQHRYGHSCKLDFKEEQLYLIAHANSSIIPFKDFYITFEDVTEKSLRTMQETHLRQQSPTEKELRELVALALIQHRRKYLSNKIVRVLIALGEKIKQHIQNLSYCVMVGALCTGDRMISCASMVKHLKFTVQKTNTENIDITQATECATGMLAIILSLDDTQRTKFLCLMNGQASRLTQMEIVYTGNGLLPCWQSCFSRMYYGRELTLQMFLECMEHACAIFGMA